MMASTPDRRDFEERQREEEYCGRFRGDTEEKPDHDTHPRVQLKGSHHDGDTDHHESIVSVALDAICGPRPRKKQAAEQSQSIRLSRRDA